MRTAKEYREKIFKMRRNVYIDGELVGRDDERLAPGINVMAKTFELAEDPQYDNLMTATSHLTGKKINRFTHIHQSIDDLLKKQEMTRVACRVVGGCIQRCMGVDALNALSVVTYEADQASGGKTEYNKRFLKYLRYIQENDLTACCAQTDVKGDRMKRPHEQTDPDLYLRVVERKSDGIVVCGAKAHNTVASYVDEILVVPTRRLSPEEKDWAVSFAVPADTEGLKLVTVAIAPRRRVEFKAPYAEYGVAHSMSIFDRVFVPWERVFLDGEYQLGGQLALLFALYHRHSYTGCKPALSELILGAAALVAEYNGIERAQHVRFKLAELISVTELIYAAGIAGSIKGKRAASGTYIPDEVFCNIGRHYAGVNIYHEMMSLAEIAGGLPATLPYEKDFLNPETKNLLNKYIMRKDGISADNQHRLFRMLQDMMCSAWGGHKLVDALHGGGSPIMELIGILRSYDLEPAKRIAKHLAGIPIDG